MVDFVRAKLEHSFLAAAEFSLAGMAIRSCRRGGRVLVLL
jgi:hypothetical protein